MEHELANVIGVASIHVDAVGNCVVVGVDRGRHEEGIFHTNSSAPEGSFRTISNGFTWMWKTCGSGGMPFFWGGSPTVLTPAQQWRSPARDPGNRTPALQGTCCRNPS